MPTKNLSSQTDNKGLQDLFKFGGGADTIFANDDGLSGYGYIINSSGGNDTIFGSDFAGRPGGSGTIQDARTETGDLLFGGDGSDLIIGGGGDDTIFGGNEDGTDASKGQNPAPTNTLIGDGERLADGSLSADVNFVASNTFDGGNDTINGSEAFNIMRGDADFAFIDAGETFNGGVDTLIAGSGGSNMVGDARLIQGDGTIFGGADTLISGSGNDQMFGDWANDNGFTGSATGGADTFVFLTLTNGFDSIGDFEAGVDKIDLSATDLTWALLDSNGSGVLDDADFGVSGTAGGNTQINFVDAANGSTGALGNLLTISGITGMVEADFIFA